MKVTFCEPKDNKVYVVDRPKKKDISKRWYTDEEFHRMKLKDDVILRCFMDASLSFGSGTGNQNNEAHMLHNSRHRQLFVDCHGVVCIRGLEKMTHDGYLKQATIRRVATLAVLQEQKIQRAHRLSCVYRISKAYSAYTLKSQQEAYRIGLADQEYVLKKCSSRNLLDEEQHQAFNQASNENSLQDGKGEIGRMRVRSKSSTASIYYEDADEEIGGKLPPSPPTPSPDSPSRWSPKVMRKKLRSIGGSFKKMFRP